MNYIFNSIMSPAQSSAVEGEVLTPKVDPELVQEQVEVAQNREPEVSNIKPLTAEFLASHDHNNNAKANNDALAASNSNHLEGHTLIDLNVSQHEGSLPKTPDSVALLKQDLDMLTESALSATNSPRVIATCSTLDQLPDSLRRTVEWKVNVVDEESETGYNADPDSTPAAKHPKGRMAPVAPAAEQTLLSPPDMASTNQTIITTGPSPVFDLTRSHSGNTEHSIERTYNLPWHLVQHDLSSVSQFTNLRTESDTEFFCETEQSVDLSSTPLSCSSPESHCRSVCRSSIDVEKAMANCSLRIRLVLPNITEHTIFDSPADFRDLKAQIAKLAKEQGLPGFWTLQVRAYSTRGPLICDEDDYELLRWVASRAFQRTVTLWAQDANFQAKDWFSGLHLCRPYVENLSMAEFLHSLGEQDFDFSAYLGLDSRYPYPNFQRQFGMFGTLAVLFAEWPAFSKFENKTGTVPRTLSVPLPYANTPTHAKQTNWKQYNVQSPAPWTLFTQISKVLDSVVKNDPVLPPLSPKKDRRMLLLADCTFHHGL